MYEHAKQKCNGGKMVNGWMITKYRYYVIKE